MLAKNAKTMAAVIFLAGVVQLICAGGYIEKPKKLRRKIGYYREQADSNYKKENYSEAALYFDSVILIDGNNPDNYFRRAFSKSLVLETPTKLFQTMNRRWR